MTADRAVLEIGGSDAEKFLQDLVTNDISTAEDRLVYAALLTPQGKYLFDFFVSRRGSQWFLDVATDRATALVQRLSMYRLRADVTLAQTDLIVSCGTGPAPPNAYADPRHSDLGWRLYGAKDQSSATDWDALRVELCVPASGIELVPDQSYLLECGFDRLNGVDFRKGCYVGQEVTARMRHKTTLRKGLARVALSEPVPLGTSITQHDKPVGQVFTQSGGQGIAYLRFDRAEGDLRAGAATLCVIPTD